MISRIGGNRAQALDTARRSPIRNHPSTIVNRQSPGGSLLAEASSDQGFQALESGFGRISEGLDDQLAALLGGQHDDPHDALGVDPLIALDQKHFTIRKLARELNQLGSRP